MKIVIINGSARKGNTLAAINAFIKGASEKNKIEIIEPDKLNIAPCKGCGVCQCSKGCVDKDDTNSTIDKIAAAAVVSAGLLEQAVTENAIAVAKPSAATFFSFIMFVLP